MIINEMITAQDFCNNLLSKSVIGHFVSGAEFQVGFTGSTVGIPVKILSKPKAGVQGSPLVIVFHGAINQKERKIPVFHSGDQIAKSFGENVTVLSIADPSLRLHPDLISTWYAGDYEVDTQKILTELFYLLKKFISPSRYLFIGGSTGAHPALLHSYNIEDSICLVTNPLPKIRGYYNKIVDFYVDTCWPGFDFNEIFNGKVKDNIFEMYRDKQKNSVIILQNSTDHHLKNQVLPFILSLEVKSKNIFISEYFSGCIGHNYPTNKWMNWIGAILCATESDVIEISEIASLNNFKVVKNNIEKNCETSIDERDIFISKRLSVDLIRG